jgi:hypothetical protein
MVKDSRVDSSAGQALANEMVRVRAGRFELGGEAWLPRGVNSYPLLQHAGTGALAAVDDILAQAVRLNRPLVRTLADDRRTWSL